MPAFPQYDWIIALITIAFACSSFGNGANDVANSYATSVAAQSLTMPQVGFLSMITEFTGAVALGSRVTGTIKNNIISATRFENDPAVLILVMACAEFGSAFWLLTATVLGFPVSTTQTVVGALVGAGIAARAQVSWSWADGSVSQVAASWFIAPLIAAAFAAILFGSLKFCILERKDPFEKAMKAIPFYLAFTASVLALFITIEAPNAPSLEELGAGTAIGIVLGVFFGVLAFSYIFFIPYFKRRLIMKDSRIRPWHIFLGPLLLRENPPLYFPGKGDEFVTDYYTNAHESTESDQAVVDTEKQQPPADASDKDAAAKGDSSALEAQTQAVVQRGPKRKPEPEERFLAPTAHLPFYNPKRLKSFALYALLQGVTRDCVTHSSTQLADVHARAKRYDNRVEHLWTYAQVASAMMMSIAHGSNDVANAVGPWVAAYQTWRTGRIESDSDTPIWILIAAGFLLGAGFWFMGYHIIRSMGNKLTQVSPTRGFAMELGAAITVLLASRLGLPISTTQTLTGAVIGVSLMNLDFQATNWRQLGFIFSGWVLTLPCAGLMAGLLTAMALNTPQFGNDAAQFGSA
ncbi:phosphate-repressible phosphate permease [Stachybotrys elegans]|uniref:Phosphate transporter n=1 Tax=Stachybotrys elegans TaxID=80388 RepID=A0A8K0T1A8_9HYPO|nr:phosphate-repressible phosphate permease [Stachybotrys elegans]